MLLEQSGRNRLPLTGNMDDSFAGDESLCVGTFFPGASVSVVTKSPVSWVRRFRLALPERTRLRREVS